ncbi:MAG: DUF366 family protein [Planctomycetes bacterium]|nr:DUF366 family protein [Planctomycetota bacterium]
MRVLTVAAELETRRDYSGHELRPHFIRQVFGLHGDAAVIFRGAASVRAGALLDLEDRDASDCIAAADMLHLIVECFGASLERMVLLQRLITTLACERLRLALPATVAHTVRRSGDDVFVGAEKFSVSIATVSQVSGLIHAGFNIDSTGAPVPAIGLLRLGLDPQVFADGLLADLQTEVAGVIEALCKVAPAHPGSGS